MISYDQMDMRRIIILGLLAISGCKTREQAALAPSELVIISSGTIGTDGALSKSMAQAKVPPLEAAQVERTLKPLFNPKRSNEKDRYEIALSTAGHFVRLTYWPNSFKFFSV